MRLTVTILLIILPIIALSQRRAWEFSSMVTTDWYTSNLDYCYFEVFKSQKYIDLKVKLYKADITTPIRIDTHLGEISVHAYNISKRKFYVFRLFLRDIYLWKHLDSGVISIRAFDGQKWHVIAINDNLKLIKEYAL